jgi:hypothetical protein
MKAAIPLPTTIAVSRIPVFDKRINLLPPIQMILAGIAFNESNTGSAYLQSRQCCQ